MTDQFSAIERGDMAAYGSSMGEDLIYIPDWGTAYSKPEILARTLRTFQQGVGKKFEDIHDVRVVENRGSAILTCEVTDGSPLGAVRKQSRWMRNLNVVRLDQLGPRGTYVLYYDGTTKTGWEILPDLQNPDAYKTVGKSVELTGGELQFARNYLTGFQFNSWLADRMPGYVVTSPKPNVLRIAHDGNATDFTLDPQTSLPIKENGVSLANPDRPVQSEMRYEAWTDVAGIHFPTKRTNYHAGLKLGAITDAAIRVNVGFSRANLSAKPADFMPDLPRR